MDFITPTINADEIFDGNHEFQVTEPGTYKMAVENISVRKTEKGLHKLAVFLVHTEEVAKKMYKGVNGTVMLEGVDKNGKSLARQLGDFLFALGFDKESIADGKTSVRMLGDLSTADWKGVGAQIAIGGEAVDLKGRQVIVKVEADTYKGKTTCKATGFYRV
jgi:hypothetical protein